jgi:starch synthase
VALSSSAETSSARTGGLPEVVEDGVTGVLVAPEEDRELAVAICDLIEDRDRAARLGWAARERAQRLFSRDRLLDEHAELYGRLVAQSAPAAPL